MGCAASAARDCAHFTVKPMRAAAKQCYDPNNSFRRRFIRKYRRDWLTEEVSQVCATLRLVRTPVPRRAVIVTAEPRINSLSWSPKHWHHCVAPLCGREANEANTARRSCLCCPTLAAYCTTPVPRSPCTGITIIINGMTEPARGGGPGLGMARDGREYSHGHRSAAGRCESP